MMKRVVMGILDTPQHADLTVRRLVALGFSPREVSVLYPDRHGDHDFGFEASTKAAQGALVGIGFGAMLGAMLGLSIGIARWIPSDVLAINQWPILMALAGASIGALALGIAGALFGASIPKVEAKYYEGKVLIGTILIGVHTKSVEEARRARAVLESVAASDVTSAGEAPLPASSM